MGPNGPEASSKHPVADRWAPISSRPNIDREISTDLTFLLPFHDYHNHADYIFKLIARSIAPVLSPPLPALIRRRSDGKSHRPGGMPPIQSQAGGVA